MHIRVSLCAGCFHPPERGNPGIVRGLRPDRISAKPRIIMDLPLHAPALRAPDRIGWTRHPFLPPGPADGSGRDVLRVPSAAGIPDDLADAGAWLVADPAVMVLRG